MSWDWRCRILWLWLHFKQPLNSNKNDIIYARIETNNSNLQLMLINKWLSLYFNYEFRVWLTKYVSFHTFFNDYTRQKRWHFFLLLNESWNRVDSMVFQRWKFSSWNSVANWSNRAKEMHTTHKKYLNNSICANIFEQCI